MFWQCLWSLSTSLVVQHGHTHSYSACTLAWSEVCFNRNAGILWGDVFGRLKAQTEAWNMHPEPKKVLKVRFWQELCIVLLCVFAKDSCWEMKYLVWSFLLWVLKPFEFYFMNSENCFGIPLHWLKKKKYMWGSCAQQFLDLHSHFICFQLSHISYMSNKTCSLSFIMVFVPQTPARFQAVSKINSLVVGGFKKYVFIYTYRH